MMTTARPDYDDEIDLVDLFATLWEGKWKIIGVASITAIGSFLIQVIQGPPVFVATTEIKPIPSTQAELYGASNAVGVFEVTQQSLLNLFLEELESKSAIEHAVRELKLVRTEDYTNSADFEDAVGDFVASIEISLNTEDKDQKDKSSSNFPTIKAEFNDEKLWRETLILINSQINSTVRSNLNDSFSNILKIAQQEKDFLLEDLDLRKDALFSNHDRSTSDRLAYLKEQAELARAIGVAKNTLEVQTFSAQNSMVASVSTDIPFYLRGYEAIEKEIELIESRQDPTAFVEGLRAVIQQKSGILQDKTLDRAASLWNLTPAATQNGFSAASMRISDTEYKVKINRVLVFALAGIIGAFIGMAVVLFSSAMHKRKAKALSS
jgi:chain length determinant protein (polysaccharide antigen chain regulator)